MAIVCLLTALGTDRHLHTEAQLARAAVGATLLYEALIDIRTIRKALTTPPKE